MNDIKVTQSSMPSFEEYTEEIKDLWESKWLTNNGVKHQKLEKQLIDYLDVEHLTLFTNGHLALEYIIDAYGLTGEIITTPFTFASTTQAIVHRGLKPVFCDINPTDYTIDADKIEELITEETSAILPVHVYGNICDVEKIQQIADRYDLKVIYDAAHTFGEELEGKGIGNYGDASMFSFHATKVFNTIEGGAVTYSDPSLKEKLNNMKNFGLNNEKVVENIGGNSKMNEFQAAMGICNLRHVDSEIVKRKNVVERYISHLEKIDGIYLVKQKKNVKNNYAYFPIVFNDFKKSRDEVFEQLKDNDITARKYFYPLTNEFKYFENNFKINETPVAKRISENILTLPLYADLDLNDVDRICEIIKS